MIRNTTNTVVAWSNADPDEISKRFHNLMIRQDVAFTQHLHQLLKLFADWPPPSYGRYLHHDGWRGWSRP